MSDLYLLSKKNIYIVPYGIRLGGGVVELINVPLLTSIVSSLNAGEENWNCFTLIDSETRRNLACLNVELDSYGYFNCRTDWIIHDKMTKNIFINFSLCTHSLLWKYVSYDVSCIMLDMKILL